MIRESGGDRSAITGGTKVLSDRIVVRIGTNPGESFLDRMIGLVEGAKRQKTPNEIALTVLLPGMTILFLIACPTLVPFGLYSGLPFSTTVIVAFLVCLIPTTIGGLLSAIGIAGMDRLIRHNVIPMERPRRRGGGGRRHDVLDKAGTITLGSRMASGLLPAPGERVERLADAVDILSWSNPGIIYVFMGKIAGQWSEVTPDNCYKLLTTHPASAAHMSAERWDSKDVFNEVNKILKKTNNEQITWWRYPNVKTLSPMYMFHLSLVRL